jgi:WD40-like Beta Propeller Repeat
VGNQKRKAEAERRRRQRARNISMVAVLVVAIAAVGAYFLFIRKTVPSVEASANAAAAFEGGDTSLVYASFEDGAQLHRLNLDTEEDEVVVDLPRSGDALAAPGSEWLSVQLVEERGDGIQPVIYLFNPDGEQETKLGAGFDAVWSPDGSRLAYNSPADPTKCKADGCTGDISIEIADPETGSTSTLVDAGAFEVIGWAGDHLIVQDESTPGSPILQSVSPQGAMNEMPIRPIDYWGASPDGKWVVESPDTGATRFFEMVNGEVTGDGEEVAIREGSKLGAGAWAHDSSYVAAFALGEDEGLDFVTFRPNAPDPVVLDEGGQASTGLVFWSPDNDAVLFQRFTGDELEAVYCPLDGECKPYLTWTSGRTLLRIE